MTTSLRSNIWERSADQVIGGGIQTTDMALRVSGLDWRTDIRRLRVPILDPTGKEVEMRELPKHRATVRTDTQDVLGVVQGRYGVIQNREAFEVMDPLVQAGLAEFYTAGSYQGGQDVFVTFKFNISDPRVEDVFGNDARLDQVRSHGVFTNNHVGIRRATLSLTPVRVVCENSLHLVQVRAGAEDRGVRITHGRKASSQLVAAAQSLWKGIIDTHVSIAAQYRALKHRRLDDELFTSLVLDVVAPLPTKTASRQYEFRHTTAVERRARLTALYRGGKGQQGEPTAWAAYNAVTEYADHFAVTRTNRLQAELEGTIGRLKKTVFHNLMEVV